MLSVTLALGYLSIPVIIENSVYTTISKYDQPSWKYGSTLSISSFVQQPPFNWPTISKHVLKLSPTVIASGEDELYQLLTTSLSCDPTEKSALYALITFDSTSTLFTNTAASSLSDQKYIGIISTMNNNSDVLSLQIVQTLPFLKRKNPPSYLLQKKPTSYVPLDMKTWSTYPMEILHCCQKYHNNPDAPIQLQQIALKIYNIARLYGYWDLWRVLEGICFPTNPFYFNLFYYFYFIILSSPALLIFFFLILPPEYYQEQILLLLEFDSEENFISTLENGEFKIDEKMVSITCYEALRGCPSMKETLKAMGADYDKM
ncbi:uncharacterized protein BX664DRAFT_72529 [Halteromyces radiatus]|uniref:uncharacterized protein n=1 Tax=Halteromyces radiatus TaxID=101107 RepID=UPI00221F77C2|nr:uncharacterized protein BX664DRAFT_72529 [Halteromyces radiatus]KAI8097080.1 hypothetical protein BX664DRAFT_72529 [Halteromyces radiatus]